MSATAANIGKSMKTTGLEWLGNTPEKWGVEIFKRKFRMSKERIKDDPAVDQLLSVSGYRGIEKKDVSSNEGQMPSDDISQYRVVRPNQLVVNTMWLNYAGLGVSDLTGYVSPAYRAYNIDESLKPRFVHYLMRSNLYVQKYSSLLYGIRPNSMQVKPYDFERIEILIPPRPEQDAIVSFLDEKLSKVDQYIANKRREIELLNEYKSTLITQVVTKGLEPNAEMKESGVEWIGKMPKGWLLLPLKRLVITKIADGPHETPELIDEGIPFISAESIKNNKIDFDYRRGNISEELAKEYAKKCKPIRNDIFIVKSGATTGRTAMVEVDFNFSIWSPLALIRANNKRVLPRFLFFAIQSYYFQKEIQLFWSYGTQQNIGMGQLEKLYVMFPETEMQEKIVTFLEQKCSVLDAMIKSADSSIEKMNEFRQSLIASAVTGKLDIPLT